MGNFVLNVRLYVCAAVNSVVVVRVCQQDYDSVRVIGLGDLGSVEGHDDLAGLDRITFRYGGSETVAVHGNCINTDVDQDLHVARACDTDGVLGISNGGNGAVIRSEDNAFGRIDSDAVAQNARREGRIRDLFSGNDLADRGSDDLAGFAADDRVCGSRYCGSRRRSCADMRSCPRSGAVP